MVNKWYQEYKKFKEYLLFAFFPTPLDIKKRVQKGDVSWGDRIDTFSDFLNSYLEDETLSSVLSNYSYSWNNAWMIYEPLRASKYVGIKKKIDSFFDILEDKANTFTIPDKFITDTIKVEGVPVYLEYAEDDEKYIYKAVDDLRKSFDLITKAKLKKSIERTRFTISPINKHANDVNHALANAGVGGFYNIQANETTLLKGRINTLSSWGTIEAIIHESGHNFYYQTLSSQQRKEWEDFFIKLKNPENYKKYKDIINTSVYKNFMALKKEVNHFAMDFEKGKEIPDYLKDGKSFLKKVNALLPAELVKKLTELGMGSIRDIHNTIWKKVVFEYDTGVGAHGYIPPSIIGAYWAELADETFKLFNSANTSIGSFPSEYASANPSEFFAEVFAAYCLWNTDWGKKNYKLLEPVFAKFIDVTNVRSAWHEKVTI